MIKYLTIRDEQIPIRVSYYALKKLKEKTGKALSDIKDDDYELYEPLLFYAIEAGCSVEKRTNPFKIDDMEMVLDEVFMEFLNMVPEFFNKKEAKELQATDPVGKRAKLEKK